MVVSAATRNATLRAHHQEDQRPDFLFAIEWAEAKTARAAAE
jgi:hypothetical protein